MSQLRDINPNAEIVSKTLARAVNVAAGVGLLNVLKSNLGPKGTLKLLVGGAGQLKLTKDGMVLLKEMQIQHPTAILIARTATAQDDVTGDGTTSTVLLCGELLRQSDRHISEGVHPRILVEGLEKAREEALKYLNEIKTTYGPTSSSSSTPTPESADGAVDDVVDTHSPMIDDRDLLTSIALTSLATKLDYDASRTLSDALVSSVQCVYTGSDEPIDLNRVEVMSMPRSTNDTRYVNGIVLDHGARHPDMPDVLTNCKIMTCNVSLEYEKTETQSGFYYSTAEEREKLVESERKWLDERCKQVIDFKRTVCKDGEVRYLSCLCSMYLLRLIRFDLIEFFRCCHGCQCCHNRVR
jgi:T-complex protein 1 subunit zeta